jgi:hypothetical protein
MRNPEKLLFRRSAPRARFPRPDGPVRYRGSRPGINTDFSWFHDWQVTATRVLHQAQGLDRRLVRCHRVWVVGHHLGQRGRRRVLAFGEHARYRIAACKDADKRRIVFRHQHRPDLSIAHALRRLEWAPVRANTREVLQRRRPYREHAKHRGPSDRERTNQRVSVAAGSAWDRLSRRSPLSCRTRSAAPSRSDEHNRGRRGFGPLRRFACCLLQVGGSWARS